MPAPSMLVFDKAGKLLQAWGGPGDPGFCETKCRQQDGCVWPAREHGIYVDQNDFVYIAGNGQARNFHGQYPWAPNFGNDSQILKFKTDGTFVYQIGTAGAKGPNSNDTNGGVNGTPEPFWPADMVVDPKTNLMYIADGYGNRRVLIVDAATGKYVGHFGAYGQNPVIGRKCAAGERCRRRRRLLAGGFQGRQYEAEILPQPGALRQAGQRRPAVRLRSRQQSRADLSRRPKWASLARIRTARWASAVLSARSTSLRRPRRHVRHGEFFDRREADRACTSPTSATM